MEAQRHVPAGEAAPQRAREGTVVEEHRRLENAVGDEAPHGRGKIGIEARAGPARQRPDKCPSRAGCRPSAAAYLFARCESPPSSWSCWPLPAAGIPAPTSGWTTTG